MPAVKFSASMDETLLAEARAAADGAGQTLSSWLAEAAADHLRLKGLRRLVEDWEAENGAIERSELDAFDAKLTSGRRATGRRRPAQPERGRAAS